jgi:hypothetical protein
MQQHLLKPPCAPFPSLTVCRSVTLNASLPCATRGSCSVKYSSLLNSALQTDRVFVGGWLMWFTSQQCLQMVLEGRSALSWSTAERPCPPTGYVLVNPGFAGAEAGYGIYQGGSPIPPPNISHTHPSFGRKRMKAGLPSGVLASTPEGLSHGISRISRPWWCGADLTAPAASGQRNITADFWQPMSDNQGVRDTFKAWIAGGHKAAPGPGPADPAGCQHK